VHINVICHFINFIKNDLNIELNTKILNRVLEVPFSVAKLFLLHELGVDTVDFNTFNISDFLFHQNNEFHDKYFSEIDINVSKCLFVFSFNDESRVNSILKDRMYVIETNGYNNKDKIEICKNFILPSVSKEMNINIGDILFSDSVIDQ
jgi:hypothetical protein